MRPSPIIHVLYSGHLFLVYIFGLTYLSHPKDKPKSKIPPPPPPCCPLPTYLGSRENITTLCCIDFFPSTSSIGSLNLKISVPSAQKVVCVDLDWGTEVLRPGSDDGLIQT